MKAGFAVTVTNRTLARAEALAKDGATVVKTPREVAERSDIVVTMVPNTPHVDEAVFGSGRRRGGRARGTAPRRHEHDLAHPPRASSPSARRRTGRRSRWLDAPVSGGELGAIEARLSIMIGGDAADVKRAMPLFEALGKTIVHIGDHGAGQACKLANQIAVALNNLGVAEALVFAASQGIDLEKTRQVIAGGAGSSWAMQNFAPKILAGDFRPGFMIDLQQKDLRLVLDNAYAGSRFAPRRCTRA